MSADFAWFVWHPLHGDGYQFWSGIAGSFLTSLPGWVVAAVLFWRQHNCHRHRCWRLAWHPDDTGHPACRVHHADHPAQAQGWFRGRC